MTKTVLQLTMRTCLPLAIISSRMTVVVRKHCAWKMSSFTGETTPEVTSSTLERGNILGSTEADLESVTSSTTVIIGLHRLFHLMYPPCQHHPLIGVRGPGTRGLPLADLSSSRRRTNRRQPSTVTSLTIVFQRRHRKAARCLQSINNSEATIRQQPRRLCRRRCKHSARPVSVSTLDSSSASAQASSSSCSSPDIQFIVSVTAARRHQTAAVFVADSEDRIASTQPLQSEQMINTVGTTTEVDCCCRTLGRSALPMAAVECLRTVRHLAAICWRLAATLRLKQKNGTCSDECRSMTLRRCAVHSSSI